MKKSYIYTQETQERDRTEAFQPTKDPQIPWGEQIKFYQLGLGQVAEVEEGEEERAG